MLASLSLCRLLSWNQYSYLNQCYELIRTKYLVAFNELMLSWKVQHIFKLLYRMFFFYKCNVSAHKQDVGPGKSKALLLLFDFLWLFLRPTTTSSWHQVCHNYIEACQLLSFAIYCRLTRSMMSEFKFDQSIYCSVLITHRSAQSTPITWSYTIRGHNFKNAKESSIHEWLVSNLQRCCEEEKPPQRPTKTETILLGVMVLLFEKAARKHYLALLWSRSHNLHQSNTLLLWRFCCGGSRWRAWHRHGWATLRQCSFKKKKKTNADQGSCFWKDTWERCA